MKVLIVSEYTGNDVSGNNNVYRQAIALSQLPNIEIEILTTLHGDHWKYNSTRSDKYFTDIIDGFKYHIINDQQLYRHRVLSNNNWKVSVNFGIDILKIIKPDILHLQHWRNLWWFLESAQILKIKTIYTPHDWGIVCLRTILVNSDNKLCDGIIDINKCSNCIKKRKSYIGNLNESLLKFKIFEFILIFLDKFNFFNNIFYIKKIELQASKTRTKLHHKRINKIINKLNYIIVPNEYGKSLFSQFNLTNNQIKVVPWYYDKPDNTFNNLDLSQNKLIIGYIGRISADKGIKRILEALELDIIHDPIHLVIAGDYNNDFGLNLFSKYKTKAGKHTVEWMGWLQHNEISKFYTKIQISILISEWVENGPLTLYESFAYNCPVIINDTPNVKEYVTDNFNGFKVKNFSTCDIALKIKFIQENLNIINLMKTNIKPFQTSKEYAIKIKSIYDNK